jgi:hypothetical protein
MTKLLTFAALLVPLSAVAADDTLIALAKYAVRQNLHTQNLAFKDIYVSEIYHIEKGKRVHRGNTICGRVNSKWFQVVKYQYSPTVEVYLGLDDKERLPCYKDVELENPLEKSKNSEAAREQEWKEQSLRNIHAAETELSERLAQERKENAGIAP